MESVVGNTSMDWCTIDQDCDYPNSLFPDSLMSLLTANQSNVSCTLPFCVQVLSFSIGHTSVRVYDLVLLVLSALFLLYLLIQLVATIRKLTGSVSLFKILYSMVFVIPTVSCVYGILSMALGYYHISAKILHTILRGSILMTELSVVVFGLFFKFYNNKQCKLAVTLCAILTVAALFTIVEGVMEFLKPLTLPCNDFDFFTHGGMIFLFSTSLLFTFAYLATYTLYLFKLHARWSLPSKKSFYRYALFLSFVNLVQAIGSLMWLLGKRNPGVGNTGICLTLITNVIYITTFPPVVYWIFLSNYFRMNKDLKEASLTNSSHINVSRKDKAFEPFFKSSQWSFSKPLGIGKKVPSRSSFLAESYGSSVASSYGSLNDDEETFVRRLTPPDINN